jgi:hypothetical protein
MVSSGRVLRLEIDTGHSAHLGAVAIVGNGTMAWQDIAGASARSGKRYMANGKWQVEEMAGGKWQMAGGRGQWRGNA